MASDWTVPPVPVELKALAPFFQRAQELKVKDAVMAYWCIYYAAKQGISSNLQNKDARPFLYQVMTILEGMKATLGNHEAVLDDDAGAAYIENFALRVFNMADNEDRREQATRSTAKKFLASANFFELLRIFDKPVDADIEEKIRYAKWKAADLAKAFREGRKPTPGDVDAPPPLTPSAPPTEFVLSPPSVAPTEFVSSPPDPPATLASPLDPPATLDPPSESAPSMSAWSPGTSLAPSPAVRGMESLEPSPINGTNVPLPHTVSDESSEERLPFAGSPSEAPTSLVSKDSTSGSAPTTPISSPRSFGAQLNLNHDGFTTPGMWSTMATPGTEDVYKASEAMGGISESPSARVAARRNGVTGEDADADMDADIEPDAQDDAWSTIGNRSMSRQNSWTVTDSAPVTPAGAMPLPPPSSGLGLGLQPDGAPSIPPVKKVHFSPSVVGGLSSASSSVAGSSPPASPERYAPTLPTVQEAAYSSDSDREPPAHVQIHVQKDPAQQPLPESGSSASEAEGSPHGVPPVIQKVPSPTGPLSPQVPAPPFPATPQFPAAPAQLPSSPPQHPFAPPPQFPSAPPQFPSAPPQFPGAGLSPQPPAPPALHPTPRYVTTPLAPPAPAPYANNYFAPPAPRSPSPPPELTSTQIARIQKHCKFAISALDYEDADTARRELRAALTALGG